MGGKAAYINKDNEIVISLGEEIVDGGIFEYGISYISDGKTYTFINEKGEELFGKKFLFTDGFNKIGLAVVEDENNIFKFIDTEGQELLKLPEGVGAEGFHRNPAITVVKKKNKFGIISMLTGKLIDRCPYKEVEISRFNDLHMVKKGANWGIIDHNMTMHTDFIFKKATVINKQGYFVAKIDEKSEAAKVIEDFSKSSFYVFRIVDGNISAKYSLESVKSVEISEDEPLLILTYVNCYIILKLLKITEDWQPDFSRHMLKGKQLQICRQIWW